MFYDTIAVCKFIEQTHHNYYDTLILKHTHIMILLISTDALAL